MKEIFKIFKFVLLMCGVFGADEDEVKTVSVMEGDSVTLNLDPTQIQGFILIEWRFGKLGSTIAKIVGKKISYEDEEISKDRLQLNQTGSLTIKNMRTKHSGRYKAEISHSTGTFPTIFIVTVFGSPDVIDAVKGEMKLMSVTEGDPVILQTDVPQLTGDELIVWRFGDEGKLIAKHDIEAKSSPFYDETDERFRDRLKLNEQTGSLTITNSRTRDSGLYRVKISSNKQTTYKRFTVTVSAVPVPDSGLSGGAVAGIVIVVLLLAAAVAVAAGVIYHRRKILELQKQMLSVSVIEGDPVTLTPKPEIQRGDEIQWLFGDKDTLIAEIKGENREKTTHDGPDERFMNRLKLDEDTGSLTITNIRTEHTGPYTLKIRRGKKTLYTRFNVSVKDIIIELMDGGKVTLIPGTEIKTGDEIKWLFGDEESIIAEIKAETGKTYDGPDERFKNRLELDKTTGSLTIKVITDEHSGYYTLEITRGREKSYKTFLIYVVETKIAKMEADHVTLKPATKIQTGDEIQWLFGDEGEQTLIAEIKQARESDTYKCPDEIFRDRLELDETTGSLTITNTRTEHAGLYTLKIRRGKKTLYTRFFVSVVERMIRMLKGDPVTLKPADEIKKDDLILWYYGDEALQTVIAELKVVTGKIFTFDYVAGGRFRDRLELNKKTGSLTIKNTTTQHFGLYKVQITSSSGVTEQTFTVTVCDKVEQIFLEEDFVTLNPDPEIQRDDLILWMFGDQDELIAQIRGGTPKIYDDVNKRFRDKLKLDEKTGSLTITKIEAEHTGLYKLQIIRNTGEILYKKFMVLIQLRYEEGRKGESVHLYTGLTKIQRDEEIEWRFGKENSLIAEIKGGTGKTHDVPDKRFRDRLELNEKTGDLIIKNSTDEHAGDYKLKIRSSEGNTKNRTYFVIIRDAAVTNEARTESMMKEKSDSREERENESVTVVMPLLNRDDLNVVNEEEGMSSL